MENASKALIIAGAILLSILIISLGIIIFDQASSIIKNNSMSDIEKNTFNSKFTQYEGAVKGAQVRSLYQQVITSNSDENNEERKVKINGSEPTKVDSEIKAANTYYVDIEYGDNGLVSNIKINSSSSNADIKTVE